MPGSFFNRRPHTSSSDKISREVLTNRVISEFKGKQKFNKLTSVVDVIRDGHYTGGFGLDPVVIYGKYMLVKMLADILSPQQGSFAEETKPLLKGSVLSTALKGPKGVMQKVKQFVKNYFTTYYITSGNIYSRVKNANIKNANCVFFPEQDPCLVGAVCKLITVKPVGGDKVEKIVQKQTSDVFEKYEIQILRRYGEEIKDYLNQIFSGNSGQLYVDAVRLATEEAQQELKGEVNKQQVITVTAGSSD